MNFGGGWLLYMRKEWNRWFEKKIEIYVFMYMYFLLILDKIICKQIMQFLKLFCCLFMKFYSYRYVIVIMHDRHCSVFSVYSILCCWSPYDLILLFIAWLLLLGNYINHTKNTILYYTNFFVVNQYIIGVHIYSFLKNSNYFKLKINIYNNITKIIHKLQPSPPSPICLNYFKLLQNQFCNLFIIIFIQSWF